MLKAMMPVGVLHMALRHITTEIRKPPVTAQLSDGYDEHITGRTPFLPCQVSTLFPQCYSPAKSCFQEHSVNDTWCQLSCTEILH